jgi:site-specific DNA recombinase
VRTTAETTQAPKRCAIYTRKSTAAGLDQDFNSLDAQREACEQYIASRVHAGWYLLPDRYDDGGFTGANLERPAFQKLLQDIDAGKIDLVIVYKVDRLSRSLLDFAQVMRRFDQAGVSFVSVTQNFSTADAMGRLTLNMLMSFAEFEREMIAERTRDKMAAARKRGKWIGGRVPLGYRVEGGKLLIHEDEAVLVREIFRVYQEEKSLVATADVLNARGWRTKKCATRTGKYTGGLRWDKGSVHRQLTNQVYVGKGDFQGQIYEGEHEAIIDEATFARVQQLLKSQAPEVNGDRRCRLDFLLRGLLRCRVCSSAMSPRWSTKRGREYRYYVCTRVASSGRQACSVRSVPAGAIEEFVVKQIRAIVARPEMLACVAELLQRQHSQRAPVIEQELAQLTGEHRRCREEGRRVLQAIGEGNARQSSMAAERLSDLDEQAHQFERRMAELRDELAVIERETVSPDEVQRAIALFEPIWDMLFPRERSRILHLLLESAVYDGTKGELELQFYPLGISRLAAEAAMVGHTTAEAA